MSFLSNTVTTLYRATSMATVANTTTAGSLIGASLNPNDSLVIPANALTVGKTLRFTIRGLYSTAGLAPGNVILTDTLGGTNLASATISSMILGASNQGFSAVLYMTMYSIGVNGQMMVMGSAEYSTGLTASPVIAPLNNGTNTVTVNTTIANTFASTFQWLTASPSNTVSSMVASLEMLN